MSTKRFLTIYFTDGSKLSITFPQHKVGEKCGLVGFKKF